MKSNYLNPIWERLTLDARFDRFTELYADREYIYMDGKSISYAEARERIDILAKGLMAVGIKRREHVAVLLGNEPEFILISYAISKIGAVIVPMNIRMREDKLAYQLAQSDCICLVTLANGFMDDKVGTTYESMHTGLLADVEQGRRDDRFPLLRVAITLDTGENISSTPLFSPGVINYKQLELLAETVSSEELKQRQAASRYPDEVAMIMYTSGTTDGPKGVMLTHDMLWRSAYGSMLSREFEDRRRIFIPIPFFHSYGFVEGILAACFVGGAIIPMMKFDAAKALELIAESKATDMLSVPAIMIKMLKAHSENDYKLTSLRSIYCSGSATPCWIWEKMREQFGVSSFTNGYGMTETSGGSVQSAPGSSIERIAAQVGRLIPGGSAGLPEFGYNLAEYKVLDPESGEELPRGEVGEFVCRGAIVTKGYYKKPLETAATIDMDGWLHTGDLGLITEDGHFEFKGRRKEIYRVAGENVSPKEVEDVLESMPAVIKAHVFGIPDEVLGEVGVAVIECADNDLCSAEVIGYCQDRLARFYVPKHIFFMKNSEIKTTETGKVQKYLLRDKIINKLG